MSEQPTQDVCGHTQELVVTHPASFSQRHLVGWLDLTWHLKEVRLNDVVQGVVQSMLRDAVQSVLHRSLWAHSRTSAPAVGGVAAHLRRLLGPEAVLEVEPLMAAEDFAFFCRAAPCTMAFLGIRNETLGSVHSLHNPK